MQSLGGPVVDDVFILVTMLGGRFFILPVLPFLWYVLHWKRGARITLFILVSTLINFTLKNYSRLPRPFHLQEGLNLIAAVGFGFPSGHAQAATVFWGSLARELRRRWVIPLALTVIALVGLSRVYLGVHFPADVLGGWMVGGVLLYVFIRLERPVASLFTRLSVLKRLALPTVMIGLIIYLYPTSETIGLLGGLAGFVVGLGVPESTRPSSPGGSTGRRWMRAGVAFLGSALIYGSGVYLTFRLPHDTLLAWSVRFGTNALLGLWLSWLAFRFLVAVGLRPDGPTDNQNHVQ